MDKQSTFQGYQPISFVRDRDIGSQMTTSDGSIYKYIPSYSASPGTDSGYHSPSRSMDFTHTHLQPLAFAHLHPTNNAAIMNDPHIMPRSSPDNLHLVRGALQLMNDEVDDLDIECK
jgi:hypothetical protein